MFNLKTAKLSDTAKMPLRDVKGDIIYIKEPTKDEDGNITDPGEAVEFEIYRMKSDHMRKWLRTNTRDKVDAKNLQSKAGLDKAASELAEDQKWQTELLAAATKNWTGLEMDGPFVCSFSNACLLYGDRSFDWIADQVQIFMQEDAHYLGNS